MKAFLLGAIASELRKRSDAMKYLAVAVLALACTASTAVAQQDTLYGPRGFLGGVRADAGAIIRYCQAQRPRNVVQCVRAEAKRRPVTQ
jgi:hypothetical protein